MVLPLSRYIENDQVKILFPMGLQKLLSGYSHDIKFLFGAMKSIKDHNELNKAVIITRFANCRSKFWHSRMLKKWLDVFPARVKIGPKNSSQMSNPKFMWFPQLDYVMYLIMKILVDNSMVINLQSTVTVLTQKVF